MYFSELPNYRFSPEGADSTQQCGVTVTIPFEDIINHIIPLFPGIINIEVGRTASFRVNESLEVKV